MQRPWLISYDSEEAIPYLDPREDLPEARPSTLESKADDSAAGEERSAHLGERVQRALAAANEALGRTESVEVDQAIPTAEGSH